MFKMYQLVVVLAMLMTSHAQTGQRPSLFESFLNLISEGGAHNNDEPRDEINLLPEYDFIVVGAGTAGCTIANRLTENPDWKVLLIEAGRTENYLMDFPILANYWQLQETDWKYKTQPSKKACLGHKNRQCNWPRGKVMGGSSVLNYMIYTRGNRRDYDNWASLGNCGWSYADVLPYFKKIEDFTINDMYNPTYHNRGGYITVGYPPWHTPLAEAFVEGAIQLGYPYVDYNGATQTGVSYLQTSMKNGTRASASRAYLHPIKTRKNLHVTKHSMVTKIVMDAAGKRAIGVEFRKTGQKRRVWARMEVILSAGAINSPHLLMLSGIGPKNDLERLNIPVIRDLKVGYNLQDHIALGGLTFIVNQSVSLRTDRIATSPAYLVDYLSFHQGPISVPGGSEALMFLDLKNPNATDGYPELEILFQGGSVISDPLLKKDFGISDELWDQVYSHIENADTWMAFPMLMLPKSKGRLMLASSDPLTKPLIFPNYLAFQEDLDIIVEGVKKIIEVSKTPAFQKYGARLHDTPLPPCSKHGFGTDNYWRCHARHITFTIYHQSGTCKMGPATDTTAVVDPRLRVYGVAGLRVIDASIMPVIPAAHTNAPTYMIAEKGADMIKQDWGIIR